MSGRLWKSSRTTPLLWEFLLSLLHDTECREIIKWLDESAMTFKIVNSYQVAMLWGEIKGRPNMDQNKLRRAIRQYYRSGVMRKVKGQKGGYKFEKLPYNPFISQQQHERDNNQPSIQYNQTFMHCQDSDRCTFDNNFGDLIAGETLNIQRTLDNDQSSQCTTDCESDDSFESWLDEEQIEILMLSNGNTSEKDHLDSLVEEIRLDYFI